MILYLQKLFDNNKYIIKLLCLFPIVAEERRIKPKNKKNNLTKVLKIIK